MTAVTQIHPGLIQIGPLSPDWSKAGVISILFPISLLNCFPELFIFQGVSPLCFWKDELVFSSLFTQIQTTRGFDRWAVLLGF